ncbi:hypothetical protein GWI33_021559 [Rhynchophorus ferrugineus]|uniref:Uncharacterized protein n=1 Tax=Rhynchophorus ferrugineus TaxID=354439 RepID=A0A834MIG4_RHYFE|nr:hypothetical protein GWI33_021559 [Rhynchophorus ferrugineus]
MRIIYWLQKKLEYCDLKVEGNLKSATENMKAPVRRVLRGDPLPHLGVARVRVNACHQPWPDEPGRTTEIAAARSRIALGAAPDKAPPPRSEAAARPSTIRRRRFAIRLTAGKYRRK